MKILLAEDTKDLNRVLSTVLEHEGYSVDSAFDGVEALEYISRDSYDCLIFDIMMPGKDGIEALKEVREKKILTPVLMLTAKSEIDDRVAGLDAGADDYLTKPFSVDELLARLRVTQRRLNAAQGSSLPSHIFENGDLKVDFAAGTAYMNGEELSLTPIEYRLLCLFCKNIGKTLTHTYLTDAIWGNTFDSDLASLRVFMASLRKKIEKDTTHPQYIQTRIGVGYRMNRL